MPANVGSSAMNAVTCVSANNEDEVEEQLERGHARLGIVRADDPTRRHRDRGPAHFRNHRRGASHFRRPGQRLAMTAWRAASSGDAAAL
jgi:hypothetical protein